MCTPLNGHTMRDFAKDWNMQMRDQQQRGEEEKSEPANATAAQLHDKENRVEAASQPVSRCKGSTN